MNVLIFLSRNKSTQIIVVLLTHLFQAALRKPILNTQRNIIQISNFSCCLMVREGTICKS